MMFASCEFGKEKAQLEQHRFDFVRSKVPYLCDMVPELWSSVRMAHGSSRVARGLISPRVHENSLM